MKKLIFVLPVLLTCINAIAQTCDCQTLSGTLSTQQLDKEDCFILSGCVIVPNGVTLTIEEGTKIFPAANSGLTVQKGGTLIANGTSSEPIVFIPQQPADRTYGKWQGITVAGEAENNVTGGSIELERTCPVVGGGEDEADNSGSMRYVQIHSAVNGLSLVSVGSGTTIDHIQVTQSLQNGFEFYGGGVNAYNLVSVNAKANDFVFNYGYTGYLQYLVGLRKDVNANDAAGSHGLLVRNQGTQTNKLTRPIAFNVTLLGPDFCGTASSANFQDAFRIMDGASAGIYDSYASDWVNYGLYLDGSATIAKTSSDLNFSYNSVNTASFGDYSSTSWSGGCRPSMAQWIEPGTITSCTESGNEFTTLAPYSGMSVCSTNPDFTITGSILDIADYSMADYDNSFITEESFRGAFGESVDWTDNWTDFNYLSTVYCDDNLMRRSSQNLDYLRIVPNPSHSATYAVFNSEVAGMATISILDKIDGKALKVVKAEVAGKGEQRVAFDVSSLRTGVYIVKVEMEGRILHQQLIVR